MRTFCCIIPARLGVLALAPITCAAASACSAFSLYALIVFFKDLLVGQKVFLGLLGSSMAILALASVIGFFGAAAASFKAVAFYSAVLSHIWLSALITGIVNFIFIMKDKDHFIQSCKDTFRDQQKEDAKEWCKERFITGFAVMVAFWGVVALLSLYLISIVRRYSKQLAGEQ